MYLSILFRDVSSSIAQGCVLQYCSGMCPQIMLKRVSSDIVQGWGVCSNIIQGYVDQYCLGVCFPLLFMGVSSNIVQGRVLRNCPGRVIQYCSGGGGVTILLRGVFQYCSGCIFQNCSGVCVPILFRGCLPVLCRDVSSNFV